MKRMTEKWFGELEVTPKEIEFCYTKEGQFCSGCIEGRNGVKTPFYVHVHVATKLIIGYATVYERHDLRRGPTSCGLMKHELERLTLRPEESSLV